MQELLETSQAWRHEAVDLHRAVLNENEVVQLAEFVMQSKIIRRLIMRAAVIPGQADIYLVNAVGINRTLEYVDFTKCKLSDKALHSLEVLADERPELKLLFDRPLSKIRG